MEGVWVDQDRRELQYAHNAKGPTKGSVTYLLLNQLGG
jgi:hypothetical protein